MAELDLEVVRHALTVARRHRFAEVELSVGDATFSARLDPIPASAAPMAAATEVEPALVDVKSTLVGYARPAKSLAIGATLKAGEIVAEIDALGLANNLESPVAGEVAEILFESGQAVQYGQVLVRVRKS